VLLLITAVSCCFFVRSVIRIDCCRSMFAIGEQVRVQVTIGGASGESITRVGMIACEGEAANSFDIMYSHKSNFAELPSEENGGFVMR
jgi:hypothetical protein